MHYFLNRSMRIARPGFAQDIENQKDRGDNYLALIGHNYCEIDVIEEIGWWGVIIETKLIDFEGKPSRASR